MQKTTGKVTYNNITEVDINIQVTEFLTSIAKKDEVFVKELKLHRSELGRPLMTIKTELL